MSARRTLAAAAAATLALVLSGCSSDLTSDKSGQPESPKTTATPVSKAVVTPSIAPGATGVRLEQPLAISAAKGTLVSVQVTSPDGKLAGALGPQKLKWTSTARLQPNATYSVHAVAVDADGLRKVLDSKFSTVRLSMSQQTYPSFVPLSGSTVGVGMPVMIRFDVPIADKAAIERHLKVTSVPAQPGAFHWISDREVHWRPEHYWQPGTKVTVNADIDSIPAGNGVYGQLSRTSTFTIGSSRILRVNTVTDQMQVVDGGKVVRTIPITTGQQPKFTTRSGVKVIVEKFRHHRMNSETIGIPVNSADGYDLDDVEYAMRVTYSGEFIHAAPWSVGSQGHANVSHGCTGMSTANAAWLYASTLVGTPVEYTGTSKQMSLTNGYGDWNEDFATYKAGSAL